MSLLNSPHILPPNSSLWPPLTSVFLLWLVEIQISSALCELLQLFNLEIPSSCSLSWFFVLVWLPIYAAWCLAKDLREILCRFLELFLLLLLPFQDSVLPVATVLASQNSIMCPELSETIVVCWSSPSLGSIPENRRQQNIVGLTSLVLSSQKPQSCTAFCSISLTSVSWILPCLLVFYGGRKVSSQALHRSWSKCSHKLLNTSVRTLDLVSWMKPCIIPFLKELLKIKTKPVQ